MHSYTYELYSFKSSFTRILYLFHAFTTPFIGEGSSPRPSLATPPLLAQSLDVQITFHIIIMFLSSFVPYKGATSKDVSILAITIPHQI